MIYVGRRKADSGLAVAYLRVSTDDQSLGIEAQRDSIEKWAAAQGVVIVGTFIDQGVSGGAEIEARDGLIAALAELKASKAGTLVIAKRDRLARDTFIAMSIERAVEANGARVVSSDGIANGDGPADELLRTILNAVAQYERSLIRGRTRVALATKRAKGECAGTLHFGTRLAADGLHVEEHPAEQEVIARVLRLRDAGMSHRAIAAECARCNLVSRSGRALNKTQVGRILRRSNDQG